MHWCMNTLAHELERLWYCLSRQLRLAYLSEAVNSALLWKRSDYMRKRFACWIGGDKSSGSPASAKHMLSFKPWSTSSITSVLIFFVFDYIRPQFRTFLFLKITFRKMDWVQDNLKGFHPWWQIAHGGKKQNIHLLFPLLKLAESKSVNIYKNKRWLWRPSGRGLARRIKAPAES